MEWLVNTHIPTPSPEQAWWLLGAIALVIAVAYVVEYLVDKMNNRD